MSRAYWVKLSSSVVETIQASDKTTHKIELEQIIPEGEMKDIVSSSLEEQGWTKVDGQDNQYEKEVGDVTLVWDLEKNEVEATVTAERDVAREVNVEGRAWSQDAAKREAQRLLQQREKQERDAIGAEEEQLQKKLTQKLGESEQDRVREINGVLQKSYAEAVKRKARRLGNVLSVQESTSPEGEYSLTITVAD